MTATAHALIAGAIAVKFPDPIIASSLAFVSHFIIDSIPHWDFGTNWRNRSKMTTGIIAIAETLFGITVTYFLFWGKTNPMILTLAIFFSLIPDWMETPWYIFYAKKDKTIPSHNANITELLTYYIYKIENMFHTKAEFPIGVITQVMTVIFFLILLQ